MESFIIGNTDFGVDADRSRCEVSAVDGKTVLNCDIYGDDLKHSELTAAEESDWSWTLYPPRFYLMGYPISKPSRVISFELSDDDMDSYDIAVYMMEHNPVTRLAIEIDSARLHVSGFVAILGEWMSFTIHWDGARIVE